ncbi:MAG: alpha-amylase family glycosyl hydrolase [Rhizobiaceae bacterium]
MTAIHDSEIGMTPGTLTHDASDSDWWRGAVIYQIYPRSFQDSDGDGIGDLRGITQRLDYVAGLGVDAIWISPFFASPMKDFGYDVSDYLAVDPMFGSIADFDAMIDKAHRLGIKVMIDQVISHTSDQHTWFAESRADRDGDKSDWYVWADAKPDGSPPNNWMSIFGGSAWEWDTSRCQYYLHNFLASQPDLNFHNSDVQDTLLDTVRFWLERGVDGFRLDTINFYFHSAGLEDNPPLADEDRNATIAPAVNPYNFQDHLYDKNQPENLDFLKRFRSLLDKYGATTAVGEVGDAQRGIDLVAAYTEGNDKVHMCYAFDFLAAEPLTPQRVRDVVLRVEEKTPDGWACWAFSNHDVVRHASRWADRMPERDAYLKMLATLLLTLRGSVCLYQGEEIGMTEAQISFEELRDPYGLRFWPKFRGRDGCRTPMVWSHNETNCGFSQVKPWLPVPSEHLRLAVDKMVGDEEGLLEHYRAMLAFRATRAELIKGDIGFIEADGDVLCFKRSHGSVMTMVAINMSRLPSRLTLDSTNWTPLPCPNANGELSGMTLSLPAYAVWLAESGEQT